MMGDTIWLMLLAILLVLNLVFVQVNGEAGRGGAALFNAIAVAAVAISIGLRLGMIL